MKKGLSKSRKDIKKANRIKRKARLNRPSIINEAVNIRKQVIFIAIPKTGTTSVRTQIKEEGLPIIPNSHLNIMQIRDLIYVYLLKSALGKNISFPTKEVVEDAILRKQSDELFSSFFKFSAVRNPWARAVSLYFRREGESVKDKMSFDEFCVNHFYASDTCFHPTLHKNQYDWLCDEKEINQMDFTYKVENFKQAINDIKERTNGRLQLTEVHENINPDSLSRSYRDIYNDKTREIIAERFEKDIDIFKYTF